MNATLLLVASTWTAGADPAPFPATPPQTVIQAQCCGNPVPVAPAAGPCCSAAPKQGLFAKLKSRFAKAPAPCAPPAPVACNTCTSHAAPAPFHHENLLDKLRDRCSKNKAGPATCGCSCSCVPGCAGPVYGAPIAPGNIPPVVVDPKKTPMDMPPKTTDPKVTDPKKGGSDAKIPDAKPVEPKKIDPKVTDPKTAPDPRPTEPKKPAVTDPKKGNAPDGLNIPALPNLPQLPDNKPGANAAQPATITPVSSPKLSGVNSPY